MIERKNLKFTIMIILHYMPYEVKIKGHIPRRGNCIRAVTGDTLGRSCFISVCIVLSLLHTGAGLGQHQLAPHSAVLHQNKRQDGNFGEGYTGMLEGWGIRQYVWNLIRNLDLGLSIFHHFMKIRIRLHEHESQVTTSVPEKTKDKNIYKALDWIFHFQQLIKNIDHYLMSAGVVKKDHELSKE